MVGATAAEFNLPLPQRALDLELTNDGSLIGYVVDQQGKTANQAQTVTVVSGRPTRSKSHDESAWNVRGTWCSGRPMPTRDVGAFLERASLGHHDRTSTRASTCDAGRWVKTVRGQCDDGCAGCSHCCGHSVGAMEGHFDGVMWRALRNPWIVGGITAAAIAIPLAIDRDDAS